MVIVFDLDETLFNEMDFILGGFRAVADHLSIQFSLNAERIFLELESELKISRSGVFDRFLKKHNLFRPSLIRECVSLYRYHKPHLSLFPEAAQCLERFKNVTKYVVTDGNQRVQRSKFYALNLQTIIKKCICTYAYGIKYQKPSPYVFLKICEWERVDPQEVVYIADNPTKDFIGLKPLGFRTIRVLTGAFRTMQADSSHEAEIVIDNLNDLTENLLRKI